VIDRAVPCDREQPRAERAAAWFESLNAVPHAQKRLLHQIFGGGSVANDGEHDGIRQFSIAIVKILHGLGLAALQAAREIFIVLAAEFEREDESWKKHEASMSISRIRGTLHTSRTNPRGDRMDRCWQSRRRRAFFA